MIDRLITVGEGLAVFRTDSVDGLRRAPDVTVSTGGAEGNVAMAAARLGLAATWLGRVGADGLGERVVRELRAEGVDVRAIVDPTHPTGLLIKEVTAGGRTDVTYYRALSAGSTLHPDDVDRLELTAGTLVHLTGITAALSASARDAVERLLARASEAGSTVSFDVNHRSRLWSTVDAGPTYRTIARCADIVFASVDEVGLLLPGWIGEQATAADAADALAADGHRHVVVTDGAHGSAARIDDVTTLGTSVPVDVVDTVGAGDAFVAGYLVALSRGDDVETRLRLASQLGAAACVHAGDWEGVAAWSPADVGRDLVTR
jgi:2-dehydro-3-deoxygluconokinase